MTPEQGKIYSHISTGKLYRYLGLASTRFHADISSHNFFNYSTDVTYGIWVPVSTARFKKILFLPNILFSPLDDDDTFLEDIEI